MSIRRDIKGYLNEEHYLDYYIGDKGEIYEVAFMLLSAAYGIAWMIKMGFLFITGPLWIIPYLIYLRVKRGGENETN